MMRTIRGFICAATVAAILLANGTARADKDQVGLGIALGASWPVTSSGIKGGLEGISFDWGFFVDIPLVSAFHITPSAMLYQLKVKDEWRSVTDVDINFKFIVPLGFMSLHAGILAGLTSGADEDANTLTPHGGLLAGAAFNLVSNLEAFVLVNYKVLFHNLGKVNDLHTYAGLMIRL